MNNRSITGSTCCLLALLCGCVTRSPDFAHRKNGTALQSIPAATQPVDPTSAEMQRAEILEREGRLKEAMESYAIIQASAQTEAQAEAARLARTRCLLSLNQPDAAIALLSDLPEKPETPSDAECMALVGEAFLRKGRSVHAESLFEVALSVPEIERESWAPPACANLAAAYLLNNKPDKACIMYDYAAHLFRRSGKYEQSAACRQFALQLCRQGDDSTASAPAPPAPRQRIDLKTGL